MVQAGLKEEKNVVYLPPIDDMRERRPSQAYLVQIEAIGESVLARRLNKKQI